MPGPLSTAEFLAIVTVLAYGSLSPAQAQGAHTLPATLADPGTPQLMLREGSGTPYCEGVGADWQGNVYYHDMNANRTMQLKAGETTAKSWRQAKDKPNGIWLDSKDNLVICQQKAVIRVKAGAAFDGKTDTLYSSPNSGADFNDVTGDSKDNLFFTNWSGQTLFFRSAATGQTKSVFANLANPNGVEWDEERKRLYVNEDKSGKVTLYDIAADYSLSNPRTFASVATCDGIVLDGNGDVFIVSNNVSVTAFDPDGKKLGEIPLAGSQMANLAFGGADFKTLFMVTNKGLYKLPMKVKGYKTGEPAAVGLRPMSGSATPRFAIPFLRGRRLDGRIFPVPSFPSRSG
jgi:gluconolactonase